MNIILLITAYFFMEFVAWFSHKYVMHGFLWSWHKDHHINDHRNRNEEPVAKSRFEKNDLFFLIYALPAIALLIAGFVLKASEMVYLGIGITLYGFTYFSIHDVIIHQRLKIPFLQKKHGFYLKAVVKAHRAHHHPNTAKDFKNYGLLVFPLRFFQN
ncbi:beta-carotene hydroxylase [Marinilabiliaceae bacterium JC017]|nr:beta-carotene hydroxylase [Marinilabiliaceae bacterium JC017]